MTDIVLVFIILLSLAIVWFWLVKLLLVPRKQRALKDLNLQMELLKIEIGKTLTPTLQNVIHQWSKLVDEFYGEQGD